MKLKLFIFILFFSPLLSASQTYTHPNIEKSVFQIYRDSDTNPLTGGTTFYIGNNRFVTNAHVIYSREILKDFINFYKKINGTVSEQDKQEIIDRFNRENDQPLSDLLSIKYGDDYIPVKKIIAINFEDDIAILEIDEDRSKNMNDLIPLEIIPFSKNLTSTKGSIYGFPSNESTPLSETIFREMSFQNIFYL